VEPPCAGWRARGGRAMTDAPTIDRPRRKRALRKLNTVQRRRIEAAVEAMLDALDAMDAPEEDLEPSLGSSETHPSPSYFVTTNDRSAHQLDWSSGSRDDREEEHDGAEPDVHDEPSLGWTDGETARGRYAGTLHGHESEPSLGSAAVVLLAFGVWALLTDTMPSTAPASRPRKPVPPWRGRFPGSESL
jgi:hypothetical protein